MQTVLLKKILQNRRDIYITCEGNSMRPLLYSGDRVLIHPVAVTSILTGDLILVHKKNTTFIHRVIYIDYDARNKIRALVTRGDVNFSDDGWIKPYQILGKVTTIERNRLRFTPELAYLQQYKYYSKEIIRLKENFPENKIPFLILKGLPLHIYYEGKFPKRFFADCDILISKTAENHAENILLKLGYRKLSNSLSNAHAILKSHSSQTSYLVTKKGVPVVFDLHTEPQLLIYQIGKMDGLYSYRKIQQMSDEFLECKRLITFEKTRVPILENYHLITYLGLHFFHHSFRGIHWLDLFAKVIEKEFKEDKTGLLGNKLTDFINRYQLESFLKPVFQSAHEYFPKRFKRVTSPIIVSYIKSNRIYKNRLTIFQDENRIRAGIRRFYYLFNFSPYPLYKKVFSLFHPRVVYSIAWSGYFMVRKFLRGIRLRKN